MARAVDAQVATSRRADMHVGRTPVAHARVMPVPVRVGKQDAMARRMPQRVPARVARRIRTIESRRAAVELIDANGVNDGRRKPAIFIAAAAVCVGRPLRQGRTQ